MARAALILCVMVAVLAQAARRAMSVLDPYLSARLLAEAIQQTGCDRLIAGDPYYTFSSVFFYTNRTALIWDGRINNLEYGSYAPGAPAVFIGDEELASHWRGPEKVALLAPGPRLERVRKLLGESSLHLVKASGGKWLFVNRPPGRSTTRR